MSLTIVLHLTHKLMLLTFYFDKIYGYKANNEIDRRKQRKKQRNLKKGEMSH